MSRTPKFISALVFTLCAAAQLRAEGGGVVTKKDLSLDLAKTIAEATLAACRAKGFHTSVAVVDRAANLIVLLRDEQSSSQTAEVARRKAYTAKMFGISTFEFQKRTEPGQPYAEQRRFADALALGGGIPIKVGNETIGGVASSGSSQEQDDECARAGLAKVADQLKAAAQ
jgi:uncharacterized protein GlcG (DUF336 family)